MGSIYPGSEMCSLITYGRLMLHLCIWTCFLWHQFVLLQHTKSTFHFKVMSNSVFQDGATITCSPAGVSCYTGSDVFHSTRLLEIRKVSTCWDSPVESQLLCCCWCSWALKWWTWELPSPLPPQTYHSCSGGCTQTNKQKKKDTQCVSRYLNHIWWFQRQHSMCIYIYI